MEIQVTRLREVLELLKPAVPRKPSIKSLTHVLLKDGKAIATDLDSMVIVSMPEADQTILFPFDAVTKMLQYVPGTERLRMNSDHGKLTLSWDGGSASYPTSDPEEFPAIPDFEVKAEATLNGDAFMPALDAALPYTATETDRPVLNGVTVVFGEPIEVAAGDGFRMAHQVLPLLFPGNFITILPSNAVSVLLHLWKKTPRTPPSSDSLIPIVIAKKQIQVALDGKRGLRVGFGTMASAIVKLVEGTPPAWLKLIPKEEPVLQALVFAREFETAVRRVRDVALQSSSIIRLVFNEGTVTVSAKGDDQEVDATITALDAKGTPNRFGVNARYLIDYLSGKDGIVTVSWTGGTAPVALQHQKTPKVLIMPMTVDWGDKQPAAAQPAAEASPETPEETTEGTPEGEIPQEPQTEPPASSQVTTEPVRKPSRRGKQKKT